MPLAEDVILAGALASKQEDKDPIDQAVIQALKDPSVLKTYRRVAYVPFDPVAKRTETNLHRNFMLASGPLIAAFVEVPAEDGKQMSELDRRINAPSSREALCRL